MRDIFCRNPGYYDGSRSSTPKSERISRLSGTTMGGDRLDGRGRVGFSSQKRKPLTKKEKEAREKSDKLDAAKALLAEVELEERNKKEVEELRKESDKWP